MFADMKSMVMEAWHEHYALLTINCMNLESVHAAIRMAEKNRTPTVLSLYQGHLAHFPTPVAAVVIRTLAESASVPVTLALDHNKGPDCIRQAFYTGSNGLMINASAFPLEENVRQTRVVVKPATSTQLYVEDELDYLADTPRYDQAANAGLITQPTDVELLIAQTGIDLLAVLVGAAHDMYAPDVVLAINFQHLVKVSRCSSMPLALRGGSDTPFDRLQLCTTLGIVEINVGAVVFERGKSALLHTLYHDISVELVDALKAIELTFGEATTPYLQASSSIGKA